MDYFLAIFSMKGNELDIFQTTIRTAVIFFIALIIIRLAKKRFLGKNTGFDVVLSVILGSVLSRAINGSAHLAQTIAASAVIIFLHWIVSFFITRSQFVANLVEGSPQQIIKEGKINRQMLKNSHLRELDILESARLRGNISDLQEIEESYIENSGKISIVTKRDKNQ